VTPKAQATKEKTSKWEKHQLPNFCTAEETVNTMKRQPIEQEKIFANHLSHRELISKIYKELLQLKSKKQSD